MYIYQYLRGSISAWNFKNKQIFTHAIMFKYLCEVCIFNKLNIILLPADPIRTIIFGSTFGIYSPFLRSQIWLFIFNYNLVSNLIHERLNIIFACRCNFRIRRNDIRLKRWGERERQNGGMANLTCSYSRVSRFADARREKKNEFHFELICERSSRIDMGLWNPRWRRRIREGRVGAGNRVRSHRRRQHGGYYTSVTPPSKLQKFYKTQRSSRDYVPRDLWPGLCYCASRLESCSYIAPCETKYSDF